MLSLGTLRSGLHITLCRLGPLALYDIGGSYCLCLDYSGIFGVLSVFQLGFLVLPWKNLWLTGISSSASSFNFLLICFRQFYPLRFFSDMKSSCPVNLVSPGFHLLFFVACLLSFVSAPSAIDVCWHIVYMKEDVTWFDSSEKKYCISVPVLRQALTHSCCFCRTVHFHIAFSFQLWTRACFDSMHVTWSSVGLIRHMWIKHFVCDEIFKCLK